MAIRVAIRTILTCGLITSFLMKISIGQVSIDIGPEDTTACDGANLELFAQYVYEDYPHALDISNTIPTSVSLGDDEYSGVIDLGFSFEFFGNTYTQCIASSNNYVSFDISNAGGYSTWSIGAPLPDPGAPLNSIMSPWQDTHPGVAGTISYVTVGTAPNRAFIYSFLEVSMFNCTDLCFINQVILFESTNVIEIYLGSKPACTDWNGGAAIMGLHNSDGTEAVVPANYNYPNVWSATEECWRFEPDGLGSYTATQIPFAPAGLPVDATWYEVGNPNPIGAGTSITVSYTSSTDVYATFNSTCSGNTYSDTISVVLGQVELDNTPTDASCFGYSNGSVVIDPTGSLLPVSIQLSDENANLVQQLNGVSTPDVVSGLSAGSYTILGTDQVGCQTEYDITIGEPSELQLEADHTDILCSGDDNGSAWANPSGGIPPYQYQWNDPLQQNIDSIQYLTAGAYTVTITDANGCEKDTTMSVIEPLPLILDLSSGADTCLYKNGAIRAEVQGGTVPINYNWTSLGGDSANFSLDSINYSWSMISNLPHGDYGVLVTDTNGCTVDGSIEVELINPPYSQFSSRSKPIEFTDPDVQYVNESSAALTYEWHFGDGEISYEEDPEHRYDTSGVFLVMLIAYNEPRYGCADTSFQYMQVDPLFTFYVPSAFTPDGDGLNDTWGPVGQNFEYESYNVKIYDRWGKLIWQTDNPSLQWDGMFENEKEVKQGMYVYVFTLKEFNTFEPKITKGTVTLYRHN